MITETNKIPFHPSLLKGDWSGIVYSISTSGGNLKRHLEVVEKETREIISDYNSTCHHSVSLRRGKREVVYEFKDSFTTFVEFRVRDSY